MAKNNDVQLMQIIEATIFAAGRPVNIQEIIEVILVDLKISRKKVTELIQAIQVKFETSGIELIKVAGGYRFQTKSTLSPWVSRLWQEKAPKYSRAMLETLALIAYKQPITRGEIEQIRGVAVNSQIVRSLQERGWIKVIGHKEVAGRPALFATTPSFLDYFGLQCLADLPQLTEQIVDSVDLQLQSDSGESDV